MAATTPPSPSPPAAEVQIDGGPGVPGVVAPSRDDPFVRHGSGLLGGPVGRRAHVGRSRWTPLRVVLAFGVIFVMFGFWQKEPCLSHPWTHEYQYTRMCYSDVYALYWSEGQNLGKTPYAQQKVEYPVLIGGAIGAAGWIGNHLGNRTTAAQWFFTATAILLGVSALVTIVTTLQLSGRRPWDAAMVAVAPVLILHAFTNWDLLAAALTGIAMVAWARRRPVLAGVFVGLGVATKLYPVLLLVALLPLCARERQWRPWLQSAVATAVTWLVVNLPVILLWPKSWWEFYHLNDTRPADWDSLWFQVSHDLQGVTGGVGGFVHDIVSPPGGGPPTALNMLSLVVAVVLWIAIGVLAYRVPRRPRVAQVAFLVVLAFLLANKVWSPQYVIWYLPLAVLALPRWRPFLVWQAAEVFVLFTRYYFFVHNDTGNKGIEIGWFFAAVLIRDAVLVAIAALVVRDMLRPRHDRVRAVGQDDPAGGVLDEGDAALRPAPADTVQRWQPSPA